MTHGGLLIGSTKKLRYSQQINQPIVNQSCCNFIKLATSTQNCIISELCGINFGPLVKGSSSPNMHKRVKNKQKRYLFWPPSSLEHYD
jgi:hypothetical protein